MDDDDDDGGMGRRAERAHYYACLRRRRVRSALGQVRDALRGGGGSGSDEEEEDAATARAEDANSCPPPSDPAALWTALEGRAAVIRPDGTLAVRPPSGRSCDLIVLGAAAEAEAEAKADGAAAHAAAAAALGRELAGGGFGFGFGGGGTAGSSPPPAPLGRDLARRAGTLVAREACGRDAASQSVPEAASGPAPPPAPSAGSRLWAAAAGLAAGLGRAAADALAGEDERELRVLAGGGGGGGGGWDASSSAAAAAAAAAADTDDLLTGGAGEGSAAAAAAAAACGADTDDLLTGGAPATAAGTVAPPGTAPILSVALAGECANLLLSYAGEELAGVRGGDGGDGGGGAALLVHRHGTGPGTLRALARDAAAAVLAGLVPEGYATLTPLSDEVGQARAETLARLPPADLDLILLALVRCGGAVLAGEDGDVAALLPGQGLEGEGAGAGGGGEGLGEIDVAVFRLRSAVATLERRAERLEAEAAVAGERARAAVAAAARAAHPGGGRGGERRPSSSSSSSSSLALAHLRRRSLLRSEAERAAAGLLNVEGALRSLLRARSDAELVRCYQIAGEAMRAARRSREEGGLGLSLAEAEGLVEDLAEEAGELDAIGAVLGGAAAAAAGGEENEDDEVDEDLLRELEELVLEGDPPGDDVPAGMREIARARPDAGPEEDKAAVGKAAVGKATEDKAAEEQKRTPVLC